MDKQKPGAVHDVTNSGFSFLCDVVNLDVCFYAMLFLSGYAGNVFLDDCLFDFPLFDALCLGREIDTYFIYLAPVGLERLCISLVFNLF